MTHRYHPDQERGDAPDALIFDDCEDCVSRTESMDTLLRFDEFKLDSLWDRMISVVKEGGYYRSEAEKRACRQLYAMAVLLERRGINPWLSLPTIVNSFVR